MQNRILHGKGKEYGDISKEIESTYFQWLSYSHLTEESLRDIMKSAPYSVAESEDEQGNKKISFFAGFAPVGEPILWLKDGNVELDDFRVSSLLLLTYIGTKFNIPAFTNEVKKLYDKVVTKS